MGFYWKDGKDQVRVVLPLVPGGTTRLRSRKLFARRGNLPEQTDDPWTAFEMDLREPAPILAAFDFSRFLVSSITFMAHLREVSVYFDDKRLAHLTKDAGIPKQLTFPPGLTPTSPMEFMHVKGLKSTREGYIHDLLFSVLSIATFHSPADYRRNHELGSSHRD